MPIDSTKNFAKATIESGFNASATSITLATGGGARMPTAPFNAVVWNFTDYPDPSDDPNREILRVTAVASETLTVTRGQEGTSASAHGTSGKVYKLIAGLTAKTFTDIAADLAAKLSLTGGTINGDLLIDGALTPKRLQFQNLTGTYDAVELDFAEAGMVVSVNPEALSYNFTTANKASGRELTIFLKNNPGTSAVFTFPAEWRWVSAKPTEIADGKIAVLTLYCLGSGESDVIAAYAVEA